MTGFEILRRRRRARRVLQHAYASGLEGYSLGESEQDELDIGISGRIKMIEARQRGVFLFCLLQRKEQTRGRR